MLKRERLTHSVLSVALLLLPVFVVFWLDLIGVFTLVIVALGIGLLLRSPHP